MQNEAAQRNGLKYKLLGFNEGRRRASIMIVATGKTFSISLKALVDSEIIDQLSKQETKHVYRRLYAFDSAATVYEMNDRHQASWMIYTAMCLALLILFVFTGIAATKLVHIEYFDIIVTPGLFLYPLTFLIVDSLNESYGLALAKKAILFAFLGNAAIVLLLAASTYLPGLGGWELDAAYTQVVSHVSGVLVAASISFLLSEYANSYLLCKIKELTQSRFLFLRVFLSTVFAVIIDSVLFCVLAFYGTLENDYIRNMILTQIGIKIALSIINILPAYWLRSLIKAKSRM